jgi:hypothetical protein
MEFADKLSPASRELVTSEIRMPRTCVQLSAQVLNLIFYRLPGTIHADETGIHLGFYCRVSDAVMCWNKKGWGYSRQALFTSRSDAAYREASSLSDKYSRRITYLNLGKEKTTVSQFVRAICSSVDRKRQMKSEAVHP